MLNENYPDDTKCYLNYQTPWQLMVATILSAQCTDDRVNAVTKDLFVKYVSPVDFTTANVSDLETDIFSTGFYRSKAKNIILSMQKYVDEYNEKMPETYEELTKFPGVGRKTANVIRCHVFNLPGIIVDTHVSRISFRLGLTKNTDTYKIELDLMKVLPKSAWIRYNTQIIAHGRLICKANKPKCSECFLAHLCKFFTS